MVTDHQATRVFRALADPTRRQILESLRRKPLPVHDLSARFAISRPAVSRHLRVLKVASLVRARSTGRETYYALNQEPMTLVQHWLDQFWTARLSGLKRLAEERPMKPTVLADIEHRITIEASVDRVWDVLTDPTHVVAWLGCMQYRPEVGRLFYMQPDTARRAAGDAGGATHCEILEITRPTRLVFSWFLPGTPKTTVTLTLEARDAATTQVTLTHTGWAQLDRDQVQAVHEQLRRGWRDFVLAGLRREVLGTC